MPEAALFASAVISTVLIVVTGLGCYAQGRRDALTDSQPFAQLGAHIFSELSQVPAGSALVMRFDQEGTQQFTVRETVEPASPTSATGPAQAA